MPDLTPQSTPVRILDLDAEDVRAAAPPILDPEAYERFEGFRETTLAYFLHPAANVALRTMGQLLYSMALEYLRYWPKETEGIFLHQCRDLAMLGREAEASDLEPFEAHVSRKCPALSLRIKKIADALEKELGSEHGEEE